MPDEDEKGRTAFLRPKGPESSTPAGKGPARLAIPVDQLPGRTNRHHLPPPPPSVQVDYGTTTEPQRMEPSPFDAATLAPKPREEPPPDDLSIDNQAPVRFEPDVAPKSASHGPSPAGPRRETMTPETPGRYEMKREFGRGGQSSVWLALDKHIGRDVAFKQLLPQHSDPRAGASSQVVSAMGVRFLREARITGQLEHPSIVPVYEVGKRADGSFYYTQKLVRGRTFTDALKQCKSLRDRLATLGHFVDLCQAIAYAHKRGVIHRDIKPDNVMVGEFGETVVLDWGLAKQLGDSRADFEEQEEELGRTQEGDVMGTPAYMSPEQAQGRKREMDAQSDVWSLGAVLYEIICGQPPFIGRNLMQMLIAVSKDPIPEPKTIEPGVPPELAAIAMKALTRDRQLRYPAVADMIRDVEAWRSGGRVQVYRYTPWGTATRWLRKNRAVAITALCVMLALAIGSVRVALENAVARRNLAQALLEKADAASRNLEWGKAAVYSAAAREEDDTAEARFRAAHKGPITLVPLARVQLPGPVDRLALSPDGSTVAIAITGQGVHLADAKGNDERTLELPGEPVGSLAFSPDGNMLAIGCGSNVYVFNPQSGEQVGSIEQAAAVEQVSFSPDNTRLVAAAGRAAHVYDATSGWKELAELVGHAGTVRTAVFAPDQSGIATSGDDGTIRFWSPVVQRAGQRIDIKLVRSGSGHPPVSRLGFSPAGRVLIAGSVDGMVRFYDLDTGAQQARIETNQGSVIDLAVAAQGLLGAVGQDNTVRLIDSFSEAPVARLEGDDSVTTVAISADGGRLASANRDGKLRLWQVTPGGRIYGFEQAPGFGGGLSLAFSPSGKQLAAGDAAGHIQVWESANGKRTSALALPQGPVVALAWSANGTTLAAAGPDETVSLFDLANQSRVPLEGHQGPVFALAFSPDGKTLASVGQDGQIHLWDPAAQTQRGTIAASNLPLRTVSFSRDGTLIATGGDDKIPRVFSMKTKKPLIKIDAAPDAILAIAISPKNRIIATGGRDQAVRTFTLSNGHLRSIWNGHGARIHSLAFAPPDGEILASASADGTIRLWDVRTGRQVVRFERAPEPRALAFNADGSLLASVGDHPSVQLVELDDEKQLLKPGPELQRQLALHKLRFEGILLVDDLPSLPGKPWKSALAAPSDE